MKNSTGVSVVGSCRTGNPIDDCWRCDPDWETNRRILADCAIGFGRNSVGGRDGEHYIVTDEENDDPENPKKGTLRFGVMQDKPLWIIFDHDMSIKLKETFGSTAITISNNYMFKHNEVMLMGHSDDFLDDKHMQVTIAFNYFGEGLVQRMPRCRHGYFHVVNNVGNVFIASDDDTIKEVTKREFEAGDEEWKDWNWRSDGDQMVNGAYFQASGQGSDQIYLKASRPASQLTNSLQFAGVLDCKIGQICTN